MINKTIQNKKLEQVQNSSRNLKQHQLFIINKLKLLSNSDVYFKNRINSDFPFSSFLQSKKEPLSKNRIHSTQYSLHKLNTEIRIGIVLPTKTEPKLQNNLKNTNSSCSFLQSKKEIQSKKETLKKSINSKWFNYFFYNNPINLLFSIDQFLFEFAKKQPQRRKSSEFKQQLKERKKLTLFYGHLSKKQLKNLLSQSKCYQGYFSKNFFSILERRLDVLLYRSGLVKNIITARQLISHKKIMVNNQILNIASYQVNPGDIIAIKSNKKNEIVSSLWETIGTKFRKRHSRFTISKNFVYKLQNIKNFQNYKQKKIVKNYIRLLLTKVEKRAHLKIKISSFAFSSFIQSINTTTLNKRENFTLLKLKPLLSKQAKYFLLMGIQKNYLSLDRKPIFQNKYMRFLNLLERYIFLDITSKSITVNPEISIKNQQKSKNTFFYGKKNTGKLSSSSTKSIYNVPGKRTLSSSTSTQKNYFPKNSSRKRSIAIYRNIVYKTLLQMHSHFLYSTSFGFFLESKPQFSVFSERKKNNIQKKIINTVLTLKLKKHITKKRSRKQILRALRVCVLKPMHIEVSYSLSTAILLYSPQRLSFPFYIDVDLILRSFR
jgi:ribosomal protein S4